MTRPDLYRLLGTDPHADHDQLRHAYRRAARTAHPDAGGTTERFQALEHAWHVLGDPARRAAYDLGRTATDAPPGSSAPTPPPPAPPTPTGRGGGSGGGGSTPRREQVAGRTITADQHPLLTVLLCLLGAVAAYYAVQMLAVLLLFGFVLALAVALITLVSLL